MMSRGFSSGKFAGGKKWTGTVAGDRGNKALDIDTVRLLKTQDLGYLRTMRNVVTKEVGELEQKVAIAAAFAGVDADEEDEELGGFDSEEDVAPPRKAKIQQKSKKIVFAESVEEMEDKLPEPEDDEDEDDDMDSEFEAFDDEKTPEEKRRQANADRLRRKLRHAKKKLKALTDAETELEMQRSRMAKTATVGGVTKKGKTFKVRERKR